MGDTTTGAFSLGPVLRKELDEVWNVRIRRASVSHTYDVKRDPADAPQALLAGGASAPKPEWQTRVKDEWVPVIANAHAANLVGLAFSGGGIRSATFNLGVLQALADLKLLFRIDYLSTVSGGGYIGGWLAAWTKRLGSFAEVQKGLAPNRVHQEDDNEPRQIRFLRMFSNYLTPKLGLFSGDALAAAGIILRNVLLNQVVLFAALVTLLLLPRLALRWAVQGPMTNHEVFAWSGIPLFVAFVMIQISMIAVDSLGATEQRTSGADQGGSRLLMELTKQKWVLGLVAAPLFAVAILVALPNTSPIPDTAAPWAGAAAYLMAWLLGITVAGAVADLGTSGSQAQGAEEALVGWVDLLCIVFSAPVAGALAGWLYAVLWQSMGSWSEKAHLTFGVPLILGIFLLAGTLHIGLMGKRFPDRRREWWGRLGGWLLLWGVVWLVVFWVTLYFPWYVGHPSPWADKLVKKYLQYLTPAWIVSTAAGLFAAKGDATGTPGEVNWRDWLAKAAPYIFVAGVVCWVSWGIYTIEQLCLFRESTQGFFWYVAQHRLYMALVGSFAVATFMAWRVDVNQFSMHQLYRNRLARCYLGASNFAERSASGCVGRNRSPNRFTGFDETDDMPLKDLRETNGYDGPYPIFNASLNLVKGQDLAWQQRKAESFVMTPHYCGYDVWLEDQDSPITRQERQESQATGEQPGLWKRLQRWRRRFDRFGYRPTEEFAFPPPRGKGLYLGTAMGISGAAASPNMGFYTSTPVAFLMTVFNVRLGQWLGNPRHVRTWRRPSPVWGLTYLVRELFAGTTDDAAYVYLSDGGHFDNMGLYELVKRRCGLIIVCDAEADGRYEYRGLGEAIRKCRIDMGIDIDLDVTGITPPKAGEPSKEHCAVGTIHYENADLNAPTGTIVYFKASLTGDESTDVKDYKDAHDAFPHESTIDQWFSESQFESYRNLGYHAVIASTTPSTATPSQAHEELYQQLQGTFTKFGFDTSKSERSVKEAFAPEAISA